ncbi:hypothetical protein PFICI_06626 [Pestalotiopsis fici W106-1]|uniref:Uncharacterized protein n=1 Tax=Pestalotiopsis fici (strain W106-1 / CGMCC3.15140) TaxID=1229662 RepID=W3X6F1_PESFW|nr:uncharacterized protein PFICI_06626 [Pestalotiopsis fici W106-1]ETS81624.1 hypothetical protein PFICI_06626 [Pestalotiopsis fici W106-1]
MPQNSSSNNQQGGSQQSGSGQSSNTSSDYRVAKDAGFDSTYDFMLSHGLHVSDPDQMAEGKAILQGYRDADAREQASKGSSSSSGNRR